MGSTAVRRAITSPVSWRSGLVASLLLAGCGDDGVGLGGPVGTTAATSSVTSSATSAATIDSDAEDSADSSGTNGSGSSDGEPDPDDGPGPPPDCDAPEVACGSVCGDLSTDPTNCGLCGRTCIIANAEAGCSAGECTLLSCDQGFSDCDGQLATGCEADADCSGGPCLTRCGSTGSAQCDASCEAICVAPPETCNAIDDDCNGQCDEGPLDGCRVGVHRSFSPSIGHFYTTDLAEATSGDLNLEAQNFYFVYPDAVDGLVPLHRCLKASGRRLYTSSADCEGLGAPELTVGYMAADEQCGSTPLYRVWLPGPDAHFYTTSAAERDNATANLGYQDQGIAGHIWADP